MIIQQKRTSTVPEVQALAQDRFPKKLDMRSYLKGASKERHLAFLAQYSLQSIVVHFPCKSGKNAGHYVAYIFTNATWWCLDDSQISEVTAGFVHSQAAFLLIYLRDHQDVDASDAAQVGNATAVSVSK